MSRPTVDEYFMQIARVVSTRATCNKEHVGAVLVRDQHILASGYNGAPTGIDHCTESGCNRPHAEHGTQYELCKAVHAELNCLLWAARHGVSVNYSTMYCTHAPCLQCTKAMINAGVSRVVVGNDTWQTDVLKMLHDAGIEYVELYFA